MEGKLIDYNIIRNKLGEKGMNRKWLIVIIVFIFIIIDLYTSFLLFLDYLAEYRTIENLDKNSYIVKEIKEHFNINYDIKKVRFRQGFPDGYYLDIYDFQNKCYSKFEDIHEDSKIYEYFKNIKPNTPIYLKYLIFEIVVELIIIIILKKVTA